MLALLTTILLTAQPSADPRLVLLDAMEEELRRNQAQLKLGDHPPPYFLSYQLKDIDQRVLSGRYGAIFEEDTYRDRKLWVDVRVGSYEFDNSAGAEDEFSFSAKQPSYVFRKIGPLEQDATALRTALWLITDEKYKAALHDYLKKKGEGVYKVEDPNRSPSFTREEPARHSQPPLPFGFDRERWARVARELSQRFLKHPEIFDSEVRITADKVVRLFVSTEGTRLVTEQVLYGLHIQAATRAPDGQLLDDSRDYYAPLERQLPDDAELSRVTDALIQELLALRAAPAIDPYTGPAILAPMAAGVLFHEAVGHRLEGERQDSENEGKTFRGQVGRTLLPRFISLYDDPNVETIDGQPLNGHYLFDDQGVRAQKALLIEDGVLRSYLLSRQPVEGFLKSNGHGRSQELRQPIARMANLVVQSKKQVADVELKRMLMAEARRQGKPYALIIRDITGGSTNTSGFGYQAFKGVPRVVYRVDAKDGKETLVRGVEIVGTPLSAMNKIMATGKKPEIFNGFCGAESGYVPVAAVSPAVLLQEIELQRTMEGKDRPPILPSPVNAKSASRD